MAALYISGVNVNILADKTAEGRSDGDKPKSERQARKAKQRKPGGFVNNWR